MSIDQWGGNETTMTAHAEYMLEHNGKVVAATPASVLIETERRSACGHCGVSDRCGTSIVAGLFKQRANTISLDNTMGLQTGDEVVIGIPEHLLLRAALWAYMAPLLFMISFALIAATAGYADEYVFLASIVGLFGGLYLARVRQSLKMSSEVVLLRKMASITTKVRLDTNTR